MGEDLEKRTWHYIDEPWAFDMHCDKCEGKNITWSEYAHKIWCYDCEIDTPGFDGIFGGPIGIETSHLLGTSFDRINMETGKIERFQKSQSDENFGEWVEESKEDFTARRMKEFEERKKLPFEITNDTPIKINPRRE